MEYRYGSHTVFQIEYHFVWVTKYRYKVLRGEVAERVRELVRQTCESFEIGLSGVWCAKIMCIFWSMHPRRWRPVKLWGGSKGEHRVICLKSFRIWKSVTGDNIFGRVAIFAPQLDRWRKRWSNSIWNIILSPSQTITLKWNPIKTRRLVDAYPDFQSVTRTHGL